MAGSGKDVVTACVVAHSTRGRITDMDKSNHANLKSTAEFFHFGSQFGEQYQGSATSVRGINADHWRSTSARAIPGVFNMTYDLDYFFSEPTWFDASSAVVAGGGGAAVTGLSVPLRCVLKGRMVDYRNDSNTHDFDHNYEFVNFHAGAPPAHRLLPPAATCNVSDWCAGLAKGLSADQAL